MDDNLKLTREEWRTIIIWYKCMENEFSTDEKDEALIEKIMKSIDYKDGEEV